MYNRNNGGNHSDSRNSHHQHHHQQQQQSQPHQNQQHPQQHQHDDEHVESISFTNSKLNNSSNRFSNMEYANVGSNMAQIKNRDYGLPTMGQDQQMVI